MDDTSTSTDLTVIMNMMLSLIPNDYKTDIAEDMDLVERGLVEMSVALNKDIVINYTEKTIVDEETWESTTKKVAISCTPALSLPEQYLASHYAYRAYLMRLKDEFNRDAINFKTLTFEIKSLEKRPEAINDSLYTLNRYINNVIAQTKGSDALLGRITQFGGDTHEV